jgi:hypothetical protein
VEFAMAAEVVNLKRGRFLSQPENAEGLLVVFSGMRGNRFDSSEALTSWLAETLPNCDILLLSMGKYAFVSFEAPEAIATDFVHDIVEVCKVASYREIRFFAHSSGAIMARKTLIGGMGKANCGGIFESRFGPPAPTKNWPALVTRLVSVAGYARGWISNPRHAWRDRMVMNLFGVAGHVANLFPGTRVREPLMFSFRRGSRFIFNTRMQWVGLMNSRRAGGFEMPQVIHVMPANDSLISSVEVIDMEISDQHASVHYMTVPQSGHIDVLDIGSEPENNKAAALRKAALLNAICGPLFGQVNDSPFKHVDAFSPDNPAVSTPLNFLDDSIPAKADPSVTDFVFVIHGIRDSGSWAKKIGAALRWQAAGITTSNRQVRTDTQSYGYFTAFPFLFPWIRKQKVEWLMDRYATAKALYPNAIMSYVGHSNGTYLAAAALRDWDCCKFENIVFAGSVVRHDYDWSRLINAHPSRVGRVLNYVATKDVVLALLSDGCRKLLRSLDLGAAGHLGFKDVKVHNVEWVVGDHGAGIAEHTWETTANFVLQGMAPPNPPPSNPGYAGKQDGVAKLLNTLAPFLLAFLICFAGYLGWNLMHGILDLPAASASAITSQGFSYIISSQESIEPLKSLITAEACFWKNFSKYPKYLQAVVAFLGYWLVWFGLFRA